MQQLSAGQNSSTPSVSLFLSVIALNSIKIKCFWVPKTQSDFEYSDFNQLKVNKYLGHKHIARFRWLRKTHTQPVHVSPLHVLHVPTRLPLHGKISEPPGGRNRQGPGHISCSPIHSHCTSLLSARLHVSYTSPIHVSPHSAKYRGRLIPD